MSEDPIYNYIESMNEIVLQELQELDSEYNSEGDESRRSRRAPRISINRGREEANARLLNDYFADVPVYSDCQFRRRFRMRREVFLRIVNEKYLRRPDSNDIVRLLQMGEARGFPGMLGSIDCMHWEWKNCPVAWKGMYTRGDHGVPTIMLEAVASQDLWIWHAYFGVAGSNNDLNVLNQSNLFTSNLQGTSPSIQFEVNGRQYNLGYYLADGIYPTWPTFVKTIPLPMGDKAKLFAKKQEGARKDVERAFGVLQARFAIVRGPARMWDKQTLSDIMYACIILHNMIVEDERGHYEGDFEYDAINGQTAPSTTTENHGPLPNFTQILETNATLHNRQMHNQLRDDLVEHIWQKFGGHDE